MQLSKWEYFADFVVYPILAAALLAAAVVEGSTVTPVIAAFAAGLASWTLVEYVIHRYVFHHAPIAADMHGRHHDDPAGYVGSPIWASLGSFALAFLLLRAFGPFGLAAASISGLMVGYLGYATIHHAIHHWTIDDRSWLYEARRRHLSHHYRATERNFGVSTGFWDRVFGTLADGRSARLRPRG